MTFSSPARPPVRGFILVGILAVVMLGAMIVLSLVFRLKGDEAASAAGPDTEQAWAAAMSGVEAAMRLASAAKPASTDWRDNPRALKDQLAYDAANEQWFFTVYSAPDEDSLEPIRYGLTDEASKLNLNTVTKEMLTHVPGMDAALIEALGGASATPELFAETPVPSTWQLSRRLQSVAELLSFRGFTPQLVFGEDANFNLRLDPNEDDGDARPPADNHDGKLDLGLSAIFTVSSADKNVDNDGVPRTDINDPKDPFPLIELPGAVTNYISAIRSNSVAVTHPADLLEAKMQVKDEKGGAVEIESGVTKENLSQVIDLFYGTSSKRQQGLINVNTASTKVLAALPGMDEPLAEAIVSARRSTSPERRLTTAWLYVEGALDADHFKQVAPFVTARSYQFNFHVVGFSRPSGKFRALEVGIDTADGKPHVTYMRDLTRFGLPLEVQPPAEGEFGANRVRERRQFAVK